jgi:thymidylate kinase
VAYYLAAALHVSQMARDQLRRSAVVCDRYVASPVGLAEADGHLDPSEVDAMVAPFEPHLARPDLTLLVVAGHRVARDRVAANVAADQRMIGLHRRAIGSENHFVRWERAARRISGRLGPVIEMNTDAMTVRRMTRAALDLVLQHADSRP